MLSFLQHCTGKNLNLWSQLVNSTIRIGMQWSVLHSVSSWSKYPCSVCVYKEWWEGCCSCEDLYDSTVLWCVDSHSLRPLGRGFPWLPFWDVRYWFGRHLHSFNTWSVPVLWWATESTLFIFKQLWIQYNMIRKGIYNK